jgi:hypothetical protein
MRSIPIALLSLGMVNSVLLGFGAMANFKEWWNQRSRLQKTFLGAAFILSGLYALGFTVQLLTPAPATVTSTPVAPAPVVTQSLPQQAAKAAMQAATLTQIAASEPQWQQVVDGWKQAIDLLSQVPDGSVYRVEAENKISEYQKNLAYAQQRLAMAAPSAEDAGLPAHTVSQSPLSGNSNRVQVTSNDPQLTREQCSDLARNYAPSARPGGQVVVQKPNPNPPWNGKMLPFCVDNMEGEGLTFNDVYFQ